MYILDIKKATQVVAFILKLEGGRIHHLKLQKVLYSADMVSLKDRACSIVGSFFARTYCGPLASMTQNKYWSEHIERVGGELVLKCMHYCGDLCEYEEGLLQSILEAYGSLNYHDAVTLADGTSEWLSNPKTKEQLLRGVGHSKEAIKSILGETAYMGAMGFSRL
jgi:hypothetical protein